MQGRLHVGILLLVCAAGCATRSSSENVSDSGGSRDATTQKRDSGQTSHPDSGDIHESGAADRAADSRGEADATPKDTGIVDAGPVPPPGAAAAGYTHRTFYEPFDDPATAVDVHNTKAPGFSFYPFTFFSATPLPASELTVSGGTLTISGDKSGYGAGVTTAHPASNAQGWEGTVFGGGAYFEATYTFDPANSDGGFPWPAWWADPIEALAAKGASQWPGQEAGYDHSVELDFFEYDTWFWKGANTYGGAIHEWYGVYSGTGYTQVNNDGQGTRFNDSIITVPSPPTWASQHRYGCLWVPWDSSTPSTPGYVQMWFDGVATTDKVTWVGTPGNPPPGGDASWTFSQVDQEHYAPILGTGPLQPVVFYDVEVWQR